MQHAACTTTAAATKHAAVVEERKQDRRKQGSSLFRAPNSDQMGAARSNFFWVRRVRRLRLDGRSQIGFDFWCRVAARFMHACISLTHAAPPSSCHQHTDPTSDNRVSIRHRPRLPYSHLVYLHFSLIHDKRQQRPIPNSDISSVTHRFQNYFPRVRPQATDRSCPLISKGRYSQRSHSRPD